MRKRWEILERRVVEVLGGERQRGSGCSWHASRKGDGVNLEKRWYIEVKTTEAEFQSLTLNLYNKVVAQSDKMGLTPVLVFVIQDDAWLLQAKDLEVQPDLVLRKSLRVYPGEKVIQIGDELWQMTYLLI